MADPDGDNVWEYTALFALGDSIEWKYSADNWNIQEDLDSNLSCITINYDPGAPNGWGYVNRVAVITGDTTFSSPWEMCDGSGGGTGQPLSRLIYLFHGMMQPLTIQYLTLVEMHLRCC